MVISSFFREWDWKRWWNTSLAASAIMGFYAVFQILGVVNASQSTTRVDGTLGNSTYLGIYMLFHAFVALFFMWREWKNTALRYTYGLLAVFQLVVLYYTGTRGAILGLLGGLLLAALLNVRNRNDGEEWIRKSSIAVLVGAVLLVGGLFAARNTAFVSGNPLLSRFFSLTAEGIRTEGRYFIWPIALEGVKEKPLLGWGQENFNHVFQKHYTPEMYKLEPWFDRAHNIFLDWAVSGGVLGLLSYLSLYAALLFSIWRKNNALSHVEKSIITGLVAAYFVHNFFVFDNLTSYILFFGLLAYIHSKVVPESVPAQSGILPERARNLFLPLVSVTAVAVIYFVNVQPFLTNTRLLSALMATHREEPALAIKYFEEAYGVSRLGRPELAEQIVGNALPILQSEKLSAAEKNDFFDFARQAVLKEATVFENEARYQLLAGALLAATGQLDEALPQLERAKELMPNRQTIYVEIANLLVEKGDYQGAIGELVTLGEISPDHKEQADAYIEYLRRL